MEPVDHPPAHEIEDLSADDPVALVDLHRVIGLAESMNPPGVVLGLPGVLEKMILRCATPCASIGISLT